MYTCICSEARAVDVHVHTCILLIKIDAVVAVNEGRHKCDTHAIKYLIIFHGESWSYWLLQNLIGFAVSIATDLNTYLTSAFVVKMSYVGQQFAGLNVQSCKRYVALKYDFP